MTLLFRNALIQRALNSSTRITTSHVVVVVVVVVIIITMTIINYNNVTRHQVPTRLSPLLIPWKACSSSAPPLGTPPPHR
jgi:hypothetical protein